MTLFDLMSDAVPQSDNKTFLLAPINDAPSICNSREVYEGAAAYEQFFIRAPAERSGVRAPLDGSHVKSVYSTQTLWRMDEWTTPAFHNLDAFNLVLRPVGWHHATVLTCAEKGEVFGIYPIWRGVKQKPFARDDYKFLQACAPHVTHGLRTAQLIDEREKPDMGEFLPTALWGTGLILMDAKGNIIAIDDEARSIFANVAGFDGVHLPTLRNDLNTALRYVHRMLISVFHKDDDNSVGAPVVRLWSHWTGIVLKLRGVMLQGVDGREYINVLVERGETESLRRERMLARWGLTDRESEVLGFLTMGKTDPEIAIILGMSPRTVSKHVEHILQGLAVETRTAAALAAVE